MTDSVYDQLVTELSRDIVAQTAPEELPLYRQISEAYARDPEKTISRQKDKNQDLGFGTAEAAALLTPVVLAAMKSVVLFLGAEVLKAVKQESQTAIGEGVKGLFKKHSPAESKGGAAEAKDSAAPGLSPDELKQVRLLVLEKARQLALSEDQASLLSDSIVGSLVAAA